MTHLVPFTSSPRRSESIQPNRTQIHFPRFFFSQNLHQFASGEPDLPYPSPFSSNLTLSPYNLQTLHEDEQPIFPSSYNHYDQPIFIIVSRSLCLQPPFPFLTRFLKLVLPKWSYHSSPLLFPLCRCPHYMFIFSISL